MCGTGDGNKEPLPQELVLNLLKDKRYQVKSESRDEVANSISNQQKAMFSYSSLFEENKNRIKRDFDEYIRDKQ